MKTHKLLVFTNNFIRNRTFRLYASLFATIQGVLRMGIFDGSVFSGINFGTDKMFGLLMLIFGICTFMTTWNGWRLSWVGRTSAVCLAAIFGAFGVAVLPFNTVSACGSWLLTIFLILEAVMIYEC